MTLKKPRIEGLFLRSRVARRIFALFMLSALLPALLLALVAAWQMSTLQQDYARRQLSQDAVNLARGLYERLRGAHFSLAVQAAGVRSGLADGVSLPAQSEEGMFSRVFLLEVGTTRQLAGASSGPTPPEGVLKDAVIDHHLRRGESALLTGAAAEHPKVWLVTAIDAAAPDRGALLAELRAEYLWGDEDDFSDLTPVCVMDGASRPLFCSDARRSALVAGDMRGSGHLGEWLYETRPLFLRARFGADDWQVVTVRAGVSGEQGWASLRTMILGVILLAVLLVALLSVSQIRRTLVPLERLIEGARRIEGEDFQATVEVPPGDEFGELADAFNRMAGRLGRQIGTLRALAEIDQEILSRVDTTQIVERVQQRLQLIWPDAVTAMVLFDQLAADFGIVHLNDGLEGVGAKIPTRIEAWLLDRLARDYDGMWFEVGDTQLPDFLDMMARAGARRILVLPIYWNDRVQGLLAVGLREALDFHSELVEQARDLGKRIGVALAAHARDEELKYRAYHDSLTGMPNRALMLERLGQEIAHARRDSRQLAVLFMDLDRFKHINDSQGHECGDKLLCQVADRLVSCTREGDTVARLGGDEFVVLLPGLSDVQQAARLANETRELLAEPFIIDGTNNFVGASIGVAIFPQDGTLPTELLKKADIAMYRAKTSGRGRVVFFEESMNAAQQERTNLERELRLALQRNQLSLHYQPRLRAEDGRLVAAEALLRWQHPELGNVEPERFISLAEEIGLMDELGAWVLQTVCQQVARWREAGYFFNVSYNVSGHQLRSGALVQQVQQALQQAGVPPRSLELEVTEGTLLHDVEAVGEQLHQIKQTGVTIALDDFGTGYSSLTYLQKLPLDIIKIDRSFISGMGRDPSADSIVYSIIALSHALGKAVVAEGVEDERQLELLHAWSCEQVQGNFCSPPLTVADLEDFLAPSRPAEAT